MKWFIRLLANIAVLAIPFYFFFSHQQLHNISLDKLFFGFFIGLFMFSVAWSCGIFGIIRQVILASLLGQMTLKIFVTNEIELTQAGYFLLVALVTHFFTSFWKTGSEWTNTFKTLWLDWLILIPLFPIFSFTDLILKTDLFFPLMGYWIGSTFYSVGTLKASEFVWKWINSEVYLSQQESKESSSVDDEISSKYMIFIHHMSILKSTWNGIHFGELLTSSWFILFLFVNWMQQNGWERWQMAYTVGTFSSYLLYLGPIAAGSALSPKELAAVQDAIN